MVGVAVGEPDGVGVAVGVAVGSEAIDRLTTLTTPLAKVVVATTVLPSRSSTVSPALPPSTASVLGLSPGMRR